MKVFYEDYGFFIWYIAIIGGCWALVLIIKLLPKNFQSFLFNDYKEKSKYKERINKFTKCKEEAIENRDNQLTKDCDWQLFWLENIKEYYYNVFF